MATFSEQFRIPGLVATSDLSSHQYKVVKLASTAGQVKVSAAATDAHLGILQNDPAAGEVASIAFVGVSKAVAAASVTAGSLLTANSTGQVKATTTGNDRVIGLALSASTNAGDIIRVMLSGLSNY
jgi:hypothetical protein